MHTSASDNLGMSNDLGQVIPVASTEIRGPFGPGAVVIATLSNPREKFWGMVLALAPEGLSLSGAELASFEDLAVPDGSLPSLSQRFLSKTGLEPSAALRPRPLTNPAGPKAAATKERG